MEARVVISALLLFTGCFLVLVASIGVVRFPDFYSRIHPAGKADTMGQTLVFLGLIVYEGIFTLTSLKMMIIVALLYVLNPTATHALAKAAWITGIKPWEASGDNEGSRDEDINMHQDKKRQGAE